MFPEEVIAAHQFFIERRRTLRPFGETRTASGEEWDEFEQHFLLAQGRPGRLPAALRDAVRA